MSAEGEPAPLVVERRLYVEPVEQGGRGIQDAAVRRVAGRP